MPQWLSRRKRTPEQAAGAPPDWERRRDVAARTFVPWLERAFPLAGTTVLEYGCGHGAVAAAFSPHVGRHIGIDIDGPAVAWAQRCLRDLGLEAELHHAPLDRILGDVEQLQGQVDVFLCYAVLEHMDARERLELLDLARRTAKPDGVIVVIESPNRLLPWDYHTAQMPFNYQLPDELALKWWDRSPREDFVAAMREARDQGDAALYEAFVRWGRGMSHHELELGLGDLGRRALACGWETDLLDERDVHRAELRLQQEMDLSTPELPPSFSRYWLDVVLAATPRETRAEHMRPWAPQTLGSQGAQMAADGTIVLAGEDSRLFVELPKATTRVAVGVTEASTVTLSTADGGTAGADVTTPGDGRPGYAEIHLATPAQHLDLRVDRAVSIPYVGYAG